MPHALHSTDDLLALVREVEAHREPNLPEEEEARREREKKRRRAEERLVANRAKAVHADYDHRDEVLRVDRPRNPSGKACAMEESQYLYEQQSDGRDADGMPVFNQIHKAVSSYLTFALSGVPDCTLGCEPRELNEGWTPDIAQFYEQEAVENAERVRSVIDRHLARSQWPDVRGRALRDASVMGVGYFVFPDDDVMDMRDPRVARLRRDRTKLTRSARTRAALERIKAEPRVLHVDPRDVVWQAGVTSAYEHSFGQEMLRVSIVDDKLTDSLRARTGREIKPFSGRGFRRTTETSANTGSDGALKYTRGGGQTTAVVTTWETVLVETEVRVEEHEVGADGLPVRRVHRDREVTATMVKTVIAGDELLSVQTWTEAERDVALPVVPIYVKESGNHPYGYSLTMLLKRSQDFINRLRLMLFEQGVKALSISGGLIDGSKLGPNDDAASIIAKLNRGEWAVVEGNQDGDNPYPLGHSFKDVFFNPNSALPQGLSQGIQSLVQMEMQNFYATSEMADAGALSRARTGLGKQKEIDVANQAKSGMLTLLAKAVEAVYLRFVGGLRRMEGEQVVPTASGYVRLNEPTTATVRRFENGQPMPNPMYAPGLAEFGTMIEQELGYAPGALTSPWLTYEIEGTVGDTQAYYTATSDSRHWLPSDPLMKLQALASMAEGEQGLGLLTMETLRDEVLPEEIREKDDLHRAKRLKEQGAQMAHGALPSAMSEDPAMAAEGAGRLMAGRMAQASPEIAQMAPADVEARLAAFGAESLPLV